MDIPQVPRSRPKPLARSTTPPEPTSNNSSISNLNQENQESTPAPVIPKSRPKKALSLQTSGTETTESELSAASGKSDLSPPAIPSHRPKKTLSVENVLESGDANNVPTVPKSRPSTHFSQEQRKEDSKQLDITQSEMNARKEVDSPDLEVETEAADMKEAPKETLENNDIIEEESKETEETLNKIETIETESKDEDCESLHDDDDDDDDDVTEIVESNTNVEHAANIPKNGESKDDDHVSDRDESILTPENKTLEAIDDSKTDLHTDDTIKSLDEIQREIEEESKRLESVKSETSEVESSQAVLNEPQGEPNKLKDVVSDVSATKKEDTKTETGESKVISEDISHNSSSGNTTPAVPQSRPKVAKKISTDNTLDGVSAQKPAITKKPPPVPKKPSSKIAAFQEMLQKQQQADISLLAKPKPIVPTSRPKPKKIEENKDDKDADTTEEEPIQPVRRAQSQFAQNLNGMIGVGLPGMAFGGNPFAAMKQAGKVEPNETADVEEEKKDKAKVQDVRRSRARGPRGRKLPGEVTKTVEVNDTTLGNKLSLASCDLWSFDMNKPKKEITSTLEEKNSNAPETSDLEIKSATADDYDRNQEENFEDIETQKKDVDTEVQEEEEKESARLIDEKDTQSADLGSSEDGNRIHTALNDASSSDVNIASGESKEDVEDDAETEQSNSNDIPESKKAFETFDSTESEVRSSASTDGASIKSETLSADKELEQDDELEIGDSNEI